MTSRPVPGPSPVAERVRRVTAVPREVANLSEEVAALRADVAQLRLDVVDLTRHLPLTPAPVQVEHAVAKPTGSAGDDDLELFAERMAVLEDGLDEVGQRLEGMARDGVSLVSAKLEQIAQRVDMLASRPSLTQEQLEEALVRIADLARSRS
jgi:hypothetical protein